MEMFKKTKRKIIITILSVFLLVMLGSFVVIYLSSYHEMTEENKGILNQYADSYSLVDDLKDRPMDDFRRKPPFYELRTFYSVVIDKGGNLIDIDTANTSIDEDTLEKTAREIIENNRKEGSSGSLLYTLKDKGSYYLVAFLDNSILDYNANTLVEYTLVFGVVALVLISILAIYISNKIVKPLEENDNRQRQFISDASHELKTPVAVLGTNVEMLRREIGDNKWLNNIEYENVRMSKLINDLLKLEYLKKNKGTFKKLDLSNLVEGEILPFESVAFEKGLIINSDIKDDIFTLGDSDELKQLVAILLDNALRHASNDKDIDVILYKERNNIIFKVINGGHIDEKLKDRIFERFYRLDDARSSEGNHYGLGLSIAKAIVLNHDGKIMIESKNNKVSFIVLLNKC